MMPLNSKLTNMSFIIKLMHKQILKKGILIKLEINGLRENFSKKNLESTFNKTRTRKNKNSKKLRTQRKSF